MEQRLAWLGGALAIALSLCPDHNGAHAQSANPERDCAAAVRQHNAELGRIVLEEVLGKGRIAENEHIYHPQFVAHGATRDAGRAEDRAATEGWRRAAPDMNVRALRIAADCDLVAVHWEATGTNTGEGNGLPATGRSMRVRGVTFFGVRDGLVAEEWTEFDQYEMLRQLGLLPG